jgi:nucleotide-binding universal stress UspA family protein
MLTKVVERVGEEFPDVVVRTQLVAGDVAPVMGALSERACVVVIGGKRQALGRAGHLAGVLGGHGRAALVVVHSDDSIRSGPVVVGVDTGPEARHALDVAFDQASRMRVPLHVLHAVQRPAADPASGLVAHLGEQATEELTLTHTLISGCRKQYPNLEVVESTYEGAAAQGLIDAATDASMIVVGSHGRSTLAALLLGSVSRTLVGRAPCPVAVVPSP